MNLSEQQPKNFRKGDSYLSEDDDKFRLNPVFFELDEELKREMGEKGLSREHTDFDWIELTEFDEYEALGQ